jgi:DNA-binding MarR family transcriptional regulator
MKHVKLSNEGANMFIRAAPYKILESIGKYIQRPHNFDRMQSRKQMEYVMYPSKIARETGVTYSHVHQTIGKFKELGLVRTTSAKNNSRENHLELTGKGDNVLSMLKILHNEFK